ncbi:GNAT family N-acetyltransferase [Aureispira sp. CCB-QB1]|uniref:GNAT family N-acetyltransferase n=1 Tax=Aureispira sp. CCB-QB1 TaxID=1313421 RepID=UPI000695B2D2|nr:GNAT family N-acetyltransferase [Aureispira sp. CCB-QB1]
MNTKINAAVFEHFPTLESDRLLFREFELNDCQAMFELRSNVEVMRYMDSYPYQTIEDAELNIQQNRTAFIEKTALNWSIVEKSSNTFIGYFGFWRLFWQNCRAEIGYALHPDYWGQGYMDETLKTMIAFAFEQFGLHSIMANVNPNNKSSIRLLEKNKFVQEAYFKEDYFFDGRFIDSMIFSLLEPS